MSNKKHKTSVYEIAVFIFLIIYTASMGFIIYWGLTTSLKTKMELRNNLIGIPTSWQFSNYITAFKELYVPIATTQGIAKVYFPKLLVNSLIISVSSSLIGPVVPMIAAYACAYFKRFKFNAVMLNIVLGTMIIPIYGNLASSLALNKALGLYDNIWGVWIRRMGFTGIGFFVFRAIFLAIPSSYSEAAKLDGAGNFTIMLKIMIPQALGTYFTYVLLGFVGTWGDYTTPLVWIPSMPTLAYGLYRFSSSTNNSINNIPLRVTGCMITMIPVLVIYAFASNKVNMNLSIGGTKE